MSSAFNWHGIGMEWDGERWISYGWPLNTREQADSSPSSRSVDASVLPPTPAQSPESAQIEGLSPAKVTETSETGEKRAGNGAGLIMELMTTCEAGS